MKLYAAEPGERDIQALGVMVVSAIARVEVPAALWRKQRVEAMDPGATHRLARHFEIDFHGAAGRPPRFHVVALTGSVLEEGARLVAAHGLRACDGVQLASAMAARNADPGCCEFACFDKRLRATAAATGFSPVPGRTPRHEAG